MATTALWPPLALVLLVILVAITDTAGAVGHQDDPGLASRTTAAPLSDISADPPADSSTDSSANSLPDSRPGPSVDEPNATTMGVVTGAADRSPVSPPAFTQSTGWLTLGYCLLIILASLTGGWIPSLIQLTHTRMQTVISFVGGLMLGIGVFHLLPHSIHELPNATSASRWMMVGIVFMFVMLRLFHFHNHEPVAAPDHDHDHDHDHDDNHAHSTAECHSHGHTHGLSWLGIAIGLSIHTLIDGIALGASIHSEAATATSLTLFGFGTFLAIFLHKPLDAVSITSLMHAGGWSRMRINLVNVSFALMCPLGAALTLLGVHQFPVFRQEILGPALAFSAGVFVCISLSDLLPEMEFHSHNKVQLSAALALGLVLSWAITFLEPAHLH